MTVIRALERFATRSSPSPASDRAARESATCDLCSSPIADDHDHIVDSTRQDLLCSCRACVLLFTSHATARYRRVGQRVARAPADWVSQKDLARLGIVVGLAYLYRSSTLSRWVGFLPSPAGATEAEIDERALAELMARSGWPEDFQDDVEALIFRSERGEEGAEAYLVPIDACYELVALVRRHFSGFGGGAAVHRAVDGFFARVTARMEEA